MFLREWTFFNKIWEYEKSLFFRKWPFWTFFDKIWEYENSWFFRKWTFFDKIVS